MLYISIELKKGNLKKEEEKKKQRNTKEIFIFNYFIIIERNRKLKKK